MFLARASTVIEEADEAGFWLEFLVKVELAARSRVKDLLKESSELVAIFTASRKTVQSRVARTTRAAVGKPQRD